MFDFVHGFEHVVQLLRVIVLEAVYEILCRIAGAFGRLYKVFKIEPILFACHKIILSYVLYQKIHMNSFVMR